MMIGALIGLYQGIADLEVDRAFMRAVEQMPPDMRAKMIAEREADKRKAREEATAERRHQEHCAAIRSTSFWRF